MREAIQAHLVQQGLPASIALAAKAAELSRMLTTHHCIHLMGAAGSGKSICLHAVQV